MIVESQNQRVIIMLSVSKRIIVLVIMSTRWAEAVLMVGFAKLCNPILLNFFTAKASELGKHNKGRILL